MQLRYTPAAREDLVEIRDYIAKALKNPAAAANIVVGIVRQCSILKDQPLCGAKLSAKTGRETELRYLICGKHIAFYRVQESYVSIIRILDGRTNYLLTLFSEQD